MKAPATKFRKPAFACTTMIAGKNATTDGSVIVSHSDDDVSDERVIYVPARDWDLNNTRESQRAVYYDDCCMGHEMYVDDKNKITYNSTEVRRYVGKSRGQGYDTKDYPDSIPIGYIPQVSHTYAYFDSNYGVMNEHQLMIGECTCGAKIQPNPEKDKRLFYSAELSRVALERCKKAKEAVELMGDLITQYGYYGTGETLLVGDTNEAWVMEMCAYDTVETPGLWVARRVPDNEFFVAANQFRIRELEKNDLHSKDLKEKCQKLGWWKPEDGPFDWLRTVSCGEYSNPYYSLRRVWRALTKVKPSANLSPWVKDGYSKDYPFSVVPDGKLSIASFTDIYRDHYEGTEFDMTKGKGAGPWGNPTRYEANPDQGDTFRLQVCCPEGAWERPISIYRCGMFWINQAKKGLSSGGDGISWIGMDRPSASCLMPFFVGLKNLPAPIQNMKITSFDTTSIWWAFNFVANYANLNYSYMMADIVALQQKLEKEFYDKVYQVPKKSIDGYCEKNTEEVLKAWWNLATGLIVKYNNGCITTEKSIMQKIDYPDWWLEDAGYYKGPTSYEKK